MTLSETAYYLGFSDPAYFSRFFTKASGGSPRAFRQAAGKVCGRDAAQPSACGQRAAS